MKRDTRPKKGGWATGWYSCECADCHKGYMGDKRSQVCADCAYKDKLPPTTAEIQERHDKHDAIINGNEPYVSSIGFKITHEDRGTLLDLARSQQAKIDMLMLEYCPDEITDEQMIEWGENQC